MLNDSHGRLRKSQPALLMTLLFVLSWAGATEPRGSVPQRTAGTMLWGDFTVDESKAEGTTPETFYLVLRTNGGSVFSRQTVSNGGRYRVVSVPPGEYDLVVEMGNEEVARVHVTLAGKQDDFRQDIELEWHPLGNLKGNAKGGIVSAGDYYRRGRANQSLFDHAVEAESRKEYDKAIDLMRQVVNSDGKDFIALTALGTLYFSGSRLTDAERTYKLALNQRPSFAPAMLGLGKLYISQKKYELAIEILLQAVKSQPGSAEGNYFLGESYLQVKKGSLAVGYLKEAIRLGQPEAHLRLAALYNGVGKRDWAAIEYEQFIAARPDYPERKKLEQYIRVNKRQ
jgi:tetratricopeptide (TPR) repeat protein